MTEALAGTAVTTGRWRITSACLHATPGTPMPAEGNGPHWPSSASHPDYRARQVTPELVAEAHTIYVMTTAHRDAVVALVPQAADKTNLLDPDGDLSDPHGQPASAYRDCADRLHTVISQRVTERNNRLAMSRETVKGGWRCQSRAVTSSSASR